MKREFADCFDFLLEDYLGNAELGVSPPGGLLAGVELNGVSRSLEAQAAVHSPIDGRGVGSGAPSDEAPVLRRGFTLSLTLHRLKVPAGESYREHVLHGAELRAQKR